MKTKKLIRKRSMELVSVMPSVFPHVAVLQIVGLYLVASFSPRITENFKGESDVITDP